MDEETGMKSFFNYFYFVAIGKQLDTLNGGGSKGKAKRDRVRDMLSELLLFFGRKSNSLSASSSGEILNKCRVIYLHTGVNKMSKGGLRLLGKVVMNMPIQD